jgi:tetratricopeptide (TPR) repeat protein
MGNRLERFTQGARRILSHAQDNAVNLGSARIMPCHVLLAFTQEPDTIAYRVITELGINEAEVLGKIQAAYPQTAELTAPIDLAPESKKMLEHAVDEARRMGHNYIGTEHLLLGVMRESDIATKALFEQHALAVATIRDKVKAHLSLSKYTINPRAPTKTKYPEGWWYNFTKRLMHLLAIKPIEQIPAQQEVNIEDAYHQRGTEIEKITLQIGDLYHKRGVMHLWAGHYQESVADVTKVIEANLNTLENYRLRMAIHLLAGELAAAKQDADTLVTIAPDDKRGYIGRASIYAEQHEFEKATADVEAAFKLSQDNVMYALGLAEIAYHKGEVDVAVQHFRYSISMLPENHSFDTGILYWEYGKALDAVGDTKGAIKAFETALDVWNTPPLKRPQAWLAEMREYLDQHRSQP